MVIVQSFGSFVTLFKCATVGEKSICLNRKSNPQHLVFYVSTLVTELLRPDVFTHTHTHTVNLGTINLLTWGQ